MKFFKNSLYNRLAVSVWLLLIATTVLGDFQWFELPEIPPAAGQQEQPGLAGVFTGTHNNALIVAGGANFPDGLPWTHLPDGTSPRKMYHRDIYVLLDGAQWSVCDAKMPFGYSYGVSISTNDGVICIGGEWREYQEGTVVKKQSDAVFTIKYVGNGQVVMDTNMPALPLPLSQMAGCKIDDYIYIAGGSDGQKETNTFLRLDLTDLDKGWVPLTSWPGMARSHLIVASQTDGHDNCLYLFSGRYNDSEKGWQFLKDSYKYNPKHNRWTTIADVGTNLTQNTAVCVMAATGIKLGAQHIAIFGGASGELFLEVEQTLPTQIATLEADGKTAEAAALTEKRWALYTNHPGFSRDILVYHTITDTWASLGKVPESTFGNLTTGSHVTTPVVQWGDQLVIASGEVFPGVRSPKVWAAKPIATTHFGTINYIVVAVYLGLLVAMGLFFSRREKSTDDFFKAGGRIPWWAAGLSIFGTQLSAITFMAIPAKSFATNWTWALLNIGIIIVAPIVIFLFLPFYRRLNITTAYEYIEMRFNITVRLVASTLFIIFQFVRIGIVLFLPSIALSIVTGIDIRLCIVTMGILSIAYTVLGGIEAVIWTDVIQVFVLLGGAILVLCFIPDKVVGGFDGVMTLAADANKLRMFNFHFDLKGPTFWVLILGGFGGSLISYGTDQAVIQRYLTTKDENGAKKAIWTNAVLTIPATIIFFALGTALFAFFKSNPEALNATMKNSDAIFPWFIVTQLPVGIAGLLIAGVFAAAMSSLDSSMNSVATALTTDFYQRFKPNLHDHRYLFVARMVTVVIGLLGMLFALAMATWDIDSLWEALTKYIGLFGGGLAGVFLLAIFTQKTNWKGALAGLLISAILQYLLKSDNHIHGVLYSVTGMISCFITGYLASFILPVSPKDLKGLTIFTLDR